MIEEVIVIPGDPERERGQVCITAETRLDIGRSHIWARAGSHIMSFTELNYSSRLEAATFCRHMVEAVLKIPRPPRRVPRIKWGWGKA